MPLTYHGVSNAGCSNCISSIDSDFREHRFVFVWAGASKGDDWPRWNGPQGNGTYAETGTIEEIPTGGLMKLWAAPVELGYSGPAVANGRVFVTDYKKASGASTNNPGGRDKLTGMERIHCIDAKSGNVLWTQQYNCDYFISYPSGPRATPTIDGEQVYVLGAEGDLLCLSAANGGIMWNRQLKEDYKTDSPIWGYSASPTIHGDLLYVLAGGKGSLTVALDKKTGVERWRALSGESIGYCPPTVVKTPVGEQLLVWEPKALHGLSPTTGEILWSYPIAPKYEMSIIPPVIDGDKLFVSGIGETAAMLQMKADGTGVTELWKGKVKNALYSANCMPVIDGDYIYGADCGSGQFICARTSDGERMWETYAPTAGGNRRASHGSSFVSKVGSMYYMLSETGDFIIARLSPKAYEEIGRFHVIDATNECFGRSVVWSYPAYSERALFVRNDKEVVAYSIVK